jgi:hypothetical protein
LESRRCLARSPLLTAWIMNSIALTGAPRREAVDPLWTGLLLGGLLFVPGALGFFYEGASFASGTALMCVAGTTCRQHLRPQFWSGFWSACIC